MSANNGERETTRRSDVAELLGEVVELLLGVGVLLGHLLILGFPLVARLFEGLHFAFVVAGLDVGLAEPRHVSRSRTHPRVKQLPGEPPKRSGEASRQAEALTSHSARGWSCQTPQPLPRAPGSCVAAPLPGSL